ncbi:MAG: sigma-54-dependent Fis family transcriptional regulator [Haliscomenobacteraceae bacterium CHB4]|nr:Transcriptional regulatory protein ZraR [Saprospiraceae bacterium]MCE7925225.1 sigma-54-dependent Fis family transcriptional regulator [Haliscomenobacteraceae bacterium CHB4]
MSILIIDDETGLRGLLARILRLEGYEVAEAGTGREGVKMLEKSEYEVVLCDVKLPDANGVALVAEIKSKYPYLEVILLTAYGNIADGVQAIKNGAFDYLIKGDDNERIIPLVSRAFEKAHLQQRIRQLEKSAGNRYGFDNIIGDSPAVRGAIDLAKQVSSTDASVLLTGETGTGKEVFASAIHAASPRKGKAFVAVNCSAFSREILESELFGHRAGAFTGAVKDKKGLFEEAHEGTLFLDEIGDMPPELQSKLLRVLETGAFLKVGDTKPTQVNVRIIAATNRELKRESESGHFRPDLYYRLSVFEIRLPSLRERTKDIEPLALYFTAHFSQKMGKRITGISPECLTCLLAHDWPGNVRELRNIIERAVILETGERLSVNSLPLELQQTTQPVGGKPAHLSAFDLAAAEKLHILKVLKHAGGNKSEAARLLNIAPATLYRKLQEWGM